MGLGEGVVKYARLYGQLLGDFLNQGKLISKEHLSGLDLCTVSGSIVTRKGYTKILNIHKIPLDFKDVLDSKLFELAYEKFSDVTIEFEETNVPIKIDTKQTALKTQYATSMKRFLHYDGIYNTLDVAIKDMGTKIKEGPRYTFVSKQSVAVYREDAQSYEYVFKNSEDYFFIHQRFIRISGPDLARVDFVVEAMLKEIQGMGILVKEITTELDTQLRNFSLVGKKEEVNFNSIAMLMSSESLASSSVFSEPGLVGSLGLYIGIDKRSKGPIFLSYIRGTSGQNILIDGIAGSGKTMEFITQLFFVLGNHIYASSIMDYKGTEYTPLLEIYSGIEINLGEVYLNLMRLDCFGDEFSDREMIEFYDKSVSGVAELFLLMSPLEPGEGSMRDAEALLREAVIAIFYKAEVYREDVMSYKKSANLKYIDVLGILLKMREDPSRARYKEMMFILCSRISEFLEGTKAHLFNKEVNLKDILENDLIIYNFNKNQDNASSFSTEDQIRFQTMRFCNDVKTLYLNRLGRFHFIGYEELSRAGTGAKAGELNLILRDVNNRVTGARSSGVIFVAMTNSVNFLLQGGADAEAIAANFTTKLIGKINQKEYENLDKLFDLTKVKDDLHLMMDNPEEYNHHFVAMIDTEDTVDTAMFKVELPPALMKLKSLHTRNTEQDYMARQ